MPADPADYYYNQLGHYDTATDFYAAATPFYPNPKSSKREVFEGTGQTTITLTGTAVEGSTRVLAIPAGGFAAGAMEWIPKDDATEAADTWQYEEVVSSGRVTALTARTVFDYGMSFIVEYTLTGVIPVGDFE